MKNFQQRVIRRWWCWAISTPLVLLFLLGMGWAFLSLLDSVTNYKAYLTLIGGSMIVTAYLLGQAIRGIVVNSWDTWLGDLGPTQIEILREEMAIHALAQKELCGRKK